MALLDGKVAIVTGAASGIGAATARVLAREGAGLVLTDIDGTAGAALAEDMCGVYLHHDVSEEDGWSDVIAAAERLGRLDIMVANAGIAVMGSVVDMSLKDWRRQMRSTPMAPSFRSSIVFRRCGARATAARS